jgi:hypothetical protein
VWTTHIVEALLAALRLRTSATRWCKRVDSATVVIWKMLLVAQQEFRRLNAPEILKQARLLQAVRAGRVLDRRCGLGDQSEREHDLAADDGHTYARVCK